MNKEFKAGIQPQILIWARESSGLSVTDVAKQIKKPESLIAEWEAGISEPSYALLEKLAYTIYKRPMAVFFFPVPPEEPKTNNEFRTLPESDLLQLHPNTRINIRNAHAYQNTLKELFQNVNPEQKPFWKGFELFPHEDIEAQASFIRNKFKARIADRQQWPTSEFALKHWISEVEGSGMFVFKNTFKQKEISGFCLIDSEFPLIYLNNTTTKTRQIFSLIHEVAHILLGVNGISKFNDEYLERLPDTQKIIEIFCNNFAAEVLVPSKDFEELSKQLPFNIDELVDTVIPPLADRYFVSREVILRRFLDQGRVSQTIYENKVTQWNSQVFDNKNRGNWYNTQNTYLSKRFAQEVVRQHLSHTLPIEKASDFLGIKTKNFAGIEEKILQGATS